MEDIVCRVKKLNNGGMRFGTDAERALLDRLSSPDKKLKIIHIAGTNGKGSIAEYLTRILISAGKKVGTFTSPQVVGYYDQFRISALPIAAERFNTYLQAAYGAADGRATSFETETAAALLAFCREGCEYAVVECGLGGLYDATNAVARKEMAVISSIGLEHTAVLGGTIEEICAHKAGIIKNCPSVVNPLQPDKAREYFKGIGAHFAAEPKIINARTGAFKYGKEEYITPLPGYAQPYNAATAVEAATLLKIDQNSIRTGISSAFLPARLQTLNVRGRLYILDGCHNPPAFDVLKKYLCEMGVCGATLVFGSLSDKDIQSNLDGLQPYFSHVTAVEPKSPRATPLKRETEVIKQYFSDVGTAASVSEALESARGDVVVCGSFTLIGEALEWIGKK